MTLSGRKTTGKISKNSGTELGTAYLEKYCTAPAPSRDYFGLKVTHKSIIIHHWRITHGPTKCPGYREFSLSEYSQDRSAQHDVRRVFGPTIAEKTLEFVLCGGCRLDMLPQNILHILTRYLGYRDVCRMSQTSKNLYQMLQSDVVWKPIYRTCFRNLASKEELKSARHGGWRSWCKKIKLTAKDRQQIEGKRLKPIRSPRKINRTETINTKPTDSHLYSSGDAFNPMSLDLPNLSRNAEVKYPTLSPREQRIGSIYPLLTKPVLPNTPAMQANKRHLSTSNTTHAKRGKGMDSDNSSNDSAPNPVNKNKKKTLTMYLDLLETKSAPIVVREEEYLRHKRPVKHANNPNNRISCMQYRLPIPKVLHHPRTRAAPLPDIIQEREFDEIGSIAAARKNQRIPLPKQTRNTMQNDAMKIGIKEKEPKGKPTIPKKVSKVPPTSSAIPASKAPSTPPSDKIEINSIEELNVETLYSAPKKSQIGNKHVHAPPRSVPGQRTFLGGLSQKWSLNRDKSFLDANEQLLVEGRYPASLTHIKPVLPATASKLQKTKVNPVDSFGVIRKRLDASLGQDKEIDDFFENYMKNVFNKNKNDQNTSTQKPPSKIGKTADVMVKKQADDITDEIMRPVKSKNAVPSKSILKKEPSNKSLVKITKSDSHANSDQRKGKNSYPKDAVYASSVANDGVHLLRKSSSQKSQIKKGNVQIRGVNPRVSKNITLQECKSSPVFQTCREDVSETYGNESHLGNVANKPMSRYSTKSKMESMMDFDEVLRKKQAELCAESSINMHRGKSAKNKTACVASKTSKVRE